MRAKTDGTGITNDAVYFTDLMGHIYKSTLDGSQRGMLYTGSNFFTGIAYVAGGL